jgi:hypothetical protein
MKTTKTMTFYLPITQEQLKEANRKIAKMARQKEKVKILWSNKPC